MEISLITTKYIDGSIYMFGLLQDSRPVIIKVVKLAYISIGEKQCQSEN